MRNDEQKPTTAGTSLDAAAAQRLWDGGGDVRPGVVIAHPSADLYGSDRVMVESVSALVEAGDRVVVSMPAEGPLSKLLIERGAQVSIDPAAVLRKSALNPVGLVKLAATAVRNTWAGVRLIRRTRAKRVLVNTVTIPAWLIAGRLAGATTYCHVHEAEASQSIWLRRVLYAPLHLANRLIVNSNFSLDVLADTWPGLRKRSVVVLNGVLGPDAPELPRAELDGPVQLLFIGRLSPRKGPDVAIDALAKLVADGVDAHLSLLGAVFPGYEWFEADLRAQVERLGLAERVTFLGFDPDVWAHFAASDIVLVPSVVDEPFGNTAVEAILAKRPVVVSRTSGLKEAGGGYAAAEFVEPNDSADLARGITEVIDRWAKLRAGLDADYERAQGRHSPQAYADALRAAMA